MRDFFANPHVQHFPGNAATWSSGLPTWWQVVNLRKMNVDDATSGHGVVEETSPRRFMRKC